MNQSNKNGAGSDTHVATEPSKQELLKHSVYECADKNFWKIPENVPGSWHPGACWDVDSERRAVVLFKGTSQEPKKSRYLLSYAIIDPNEENGLDAPTYFRVDEPVFRRIRQVELIHHDRWRGKLTAMDVQTIEQALCNLRS